MGKQKELGYMLGNNDALFTSVKIALTIILAFLFGFFLLYLTRYNAVEAYAALIKGAFGSKRGFGETLLSMTPLILSGLGFALAYHCKLFNIGLEGQIAVGGLVAAYLGYSIEGLPPIVHIPLCLIAAAIGGALWGLGPGYLKARFGIHEVISVIMMNHIAFKISAYMVSVGGPMKDKSDLMPASPVIMSSAKITRIINGTRLHWGIFLALGMCVLTWIFLFKTRAGYKIRAVGKNRDAAETAGINVASNIILAMALSGALGGLAGGIEILGIHYRLLAAFSPGYGFDAIAVALLGLAHPLGVIGSAFLYGVLRSGAILMQVKIGVSKDMVAVITAVIIFFMSLGDSIGLFIRSKIRKSQ